MKELRNLKFNSDIGSVFSFSDSIKFEVKTESGERTAKFSAPLDFEIEDKIVLEYSLIGLYRGLAYRAPIIYLINESDEVVTVIANDDLNTDARRYTVSASVKAGKYKSIFVELAVDRAKKAEFTVYQLYTCADTELPVWLSAFEEEAKSGISKIDISSLMNGVFDTEDYEVNIGGGRRFDREDIAPFGIPFSVKADGNNAIIPPPPPKENDDIIDNFGVKARREVCRPVSRDSKTEIRIGRAVSEIYFILGISGERYQRYTFATKGNILGAYGKEVTCPLFIDDVLGFSVEIVYKDGRRDIALPKNLSEDRFSISGDVSVYAVAADYAPVESVIFHNKRLKSDFSVLAVSVNESSVGCYPELMIPEYGEKKKSIASRDRYVQLENDRLVIRNGAILASLDVSNTLKLISLTNDYAKSVKCDTGSLIKLVDESGQPMAAPVVRSASCDDESARITLAAGELSFDVSIDISEQNNLLMSLNVNNNGQNDRRVGVFFPSIDSVVSKSCDDLYYFVPKYQNVNSNETIVVCEESSPSFPMQFLSLYSKDDGAGFGLLTRERDTRVRIYHLEKRDGIATVSVEYPSMYCNIKAGESFLSSPTVLRAENGDWHNTFDAYREWLSSWYVPYKCQNKKWYRECFWLLAEITDFFETAEMTRFPIWHEKGKNPKFNFLDILEEQKNISGTYPDILHMWHWTVRYDENGRKRPKWGNWGGEDYDIYGGLAPFRAALDEFQEKTGVYSSIYMHPTLFAEIYPDFKKFEHLKTVNEKGDFIRLADSFRMCHANADWRQYALDKYPRVYSELGVPILYVDEFSLRIENRCYAEGHGHEVPSNLIKTDREFISRLKDTVPEELVLYGEYAAVDVNARYIDCNITYGILDSITEMIERSWRSADSNSILGRVMTDAYRFAFPKIVQLVLPMALRNLSWQPHKFIFWNGEAEYDSFWDVLETDGNDFTCKAYGIKKKYADCFSSDNPEMLIETLSPAICVNKFPGKDRTVYTVYNRAYRTYRGAALRIPHTEGATYYDVWRERELSVEIADGFAEIYLDIDAQGIGCICVE